MLTCFEKLSLHQIVHEALNQALIAMKGERKEKRKRNEGNERKS